MGIFHIELVPLASQSSVAKDARADATTAQAYICNLGLHWFTVRRFADQYFDLNSMYTVPVMLYKPQLSEFLNTIQARGYSVFVVQGELKLSLADHQLTVNPISRLEYTTLTRGIPMFVKCNNPLEKMFGMGAGDGSVLKIPREFYNQLLKDPQNPEVMRTLESLLLNNMMGTHTTATVVIQQSWSPPVHGLSTTPKLPVPQRVTEADFINSLKSMVTRPTTEIDPPLTAPTSRWPDGADGFRWKEPSGNPMSGEAKRTAESHAKPSLVPAAAAFLGNQEKDEKPQLPNEPVRPTVPSSSSAAVQPESPPSLPTADVEDRTPMTIEGKY